MFTGAIAPPSSVFPAPSARGAAAGPVDPTVTDTDTTDKKHVDTTNTATPAGGQSGADGRSPDSRIEQARLLLERTEIAALVARDLEVRLHEQAHASVGGALAGSPSYSYTRGPDGRRYVTGGEVSIDTSPVTGNPQATLQKMEQVISAALAPAEPSAQDLRVAAQAQATAAQARGELARLNRAENPARKDATDGEKPAALDVYRAVEEGAGGTSALVDETA